MSLSFYGGALIFLFLLSEYKGTKKIRILQIFLRKIRNNFQSACPLAICSNFGYILVSHFREIIPNVG